MSIAERRSLQFWDVSMDAEDVKVLRRKSYRGSSIQRLFNFDRDLKRIRRLVACVLLHVAFMRSKGLNMTAIELACKIDGLVKLIATRADLQWFQIPIQPTIKCFVITMH